MQGAVCSCVCGATTRIMRTVLVLHYGGEQVRGSEICLIHTLAALHDNGYRVVLIRKNACVDKHIVGHVDEILDEEFPEIMFDGGHRTFPMGLYVASMRRLIRSIREYKPSVILCNSGLPCQIAVPAGRKTGVPVLCHFHHPAPKRYFYLWLVRYATRLIFPSQFTRQDVLRKCGRDGEVIYNAIDVSHRFVPVNDRDWHFRQELGVGQSDLVIGQVAHMSGHKRPDFLLDAFADALKRRDDLRLVLVGHGPMYEGLHDKVSIMGLADKVFLTGYVPDVLPYYQHVFDINVLASREEGLGISVIEASACALPSVVTDCTGLKEVVDDGITGITFDTDRRDQLTAALLQRADDPTLRAQYGAAAREKAVATFGLKKYRERIVEQVASLC